MGHGGIGWWTDRVGLDSGCGDGVGSGRMGLV